MSAVRAFNFTYGPAGRSANSGITATIFGSYGFLGRYIANELGSIGSRLYAPYRGCELEVRHLKPMFDHGQLGLMAFSARDDESILEAVKRSDVVINLIGKHYETKHLVPTRRADGSLSRVNFGFDEVHIDIPRKIAKLSKQAGVKSFIHISALSADLNSQSLWSQTKAKGEVAVREEFPEAVIVKPSTIFGPEDRFLNWIAEGLKNVDTFPLINGGENLVQPVYSGDIAKAVMQIIFNYKKFEGKNFQLGGPAEYSYKEVVEFVSDVTTLPCKFVNAPLFLANLAAVVNDQFINPFLTPDMIKQMLEDNVIHENSDALVFSDVGIVPSSMDKLAFDYLHRFRPGGHFQMVKGYH